MTTTSSYQIGNLLFTLTSHHVDLGIFVDSNLTFSDHNAKIPH